jgi:hypothetical protein
MDATKMNFRDNSFDIAIDKGTYDALAVSIYRLYLTTISARLNQKKL